MGSFVTGEPDTTGSAAVGYVWRYIGDAGGLGVAFFVVAFALGIDRWKNVYAVLAAVGFAVFPTWAGLMATVALSPRGEEMMFPLNPATVIDHAGRAPDLRPGPGAGLPEGAAWQGAQRLAVAAAVGISAGQAGHSVREESHQFAVTALRIYGRVSRLTMDLRLGENCLNRRSACLPTWKSRSRRDGSWSR